MLWIWFAIGYMWAGLTNWYALCVLQRTEIRVDQSQLLNVFFVSDG